MHFENKGRSRNKILKRIIIIELLCTVAASCVIFFISWNHIIQRRETDLYACLSAFDMDSLHSSMSEMVKEGREQIVEELDETVWTTEDVKYRTGPDKSYKSAGSLNKFAGMKRTGTTLNKWSRVIIDDEEYYILSEYLTTDPPIQTDGGKKGEYQLYALSLLADYGWDETEIYPLINLWNRESGWNPNSHNRKSGAHGIPQAVPAKKMASEGSDYYTNGKTQIRWGLGYIRSRYGSPSGAWSHFQSKGWY